MQELYTSKNGPVFGPPCTSESIRVYVCSSCIENNPLYALRNVVVNS